MINYPNRKPLQMEKQSLSQSRGMNLENDINDSNLYYRECERALIYKKPTPIQVVRVDYPNRKHAKIVEAYYKTPSTTDYNGIYRGQYIDFEAKETRSKKSFTLQNIHSHQIEHLKRVKKQGGIAFVILRFTSYDTTYLIDADYMIDAYETQAKKSITYECIQQWGILIEEGYTPRLKYLDAVDAFYFKEV